MSSFKPIYTDRLILMPITTEYAAFMYELMNSPKWIQFIGDRKITDEQKAKEYIEVKILPQWERLGFGTYVVLLKENQQVIGNCGLYDREGIDGLDIGFAFLPDYEGKGYGYEAAYTLMNKVQTEFNISKISAITTKDNIASQKLLEKLGLSFKKFTNVPDDEVELMLFTNE